MKVLLFSFLLLCSLFSSASDLILAKQITLKSDSLGEDRNLLIKLPNQYYENSATYPVLYVLHAQWDMLSTLATLDLLADQIPNFIVIGVQSSGKELSPNKGKVTPFAEFISQEVVTYVNANYRIAPYSILSGHSNSGRFVLDYWLNNPAAFSSYFAFSPSVDDGYIVDMISQSDIESLKSKAPLAITIANEGEHMQQPFSNLTQKLVSFFFLFSFVYFLFNFFTITPYQYTYLNLLNGKSENRYKKFENDYWGVSIKELIKKSNFQRNKTILITSCGVNDDVAKEYFKKNGHVNLIFVKPDEANFIIMTNRSSLLDNKKISNCFDKFKGADIFKIEKNGLVLSVIRKI